MFFRNLSVFFRTHTVSSTRWLALAMMAATTVAMLSGCSDKHH